MMIRFLAAALLVASSAAFAVDQAAPTAAVTPQAAGVMAESVTAFFRPQNIDPNPADLSRVLGVLQTVGGQGAPARADVEPIVERIRLAADEFVPIDPTEQEPEPGLASSVKLELLAGPLKAWLTDGQKEFIPKKQAEYAGKLSAADRRRLSAKMKAWADALNGSRDAGALAAAQAPAVDAGALGPAGAVKEDLWRDHSHLSDHVAQIGQAPDVVDRPGRFEALTPGSGPAPATPSSPFSEIALMAVGFSALGGLLRVSLKSARGRLGQVAAVLGAAAFAAVSGSLGLHLAQLGWLWTGFGLGAYAGYAAVIGAILLGRAIDSARGSRDGDMGPFEMVAQLGIFPLPVLASLGTWLLSMGAFAHPASALLIALAAVPASLGAAYFASIFLVIIASGFSKGA